MTLDELITALEAADPSLVLPDGFTNPHSYCGYYEDLAFEPASNVTVAVMLADARSALGSTYEGWKGGDFVMRGYTDCWLSMEGSCSGDSIGPLLLRFMLAAGETAEPGTEAHPSELRWRVEIHDGGQWMPCGSLTTHRQIALDALAARRAAAKTWAADGQPVRYRVVRETTTYTVEDET